MEVLVLEEQSDPALSTVQATSPSPDKDISKRAFARIARSTTWVGISIETITLPVARSR